MKKTCIFYGKQPACRWILMAIAIIFSMNVRAEALKVTLLLPEPPESSFWGQVTNFARAVAEDLDITLDVVHPADRSKASSYLIWRSAKHIMEPGYKSDYVLTSYWSDRFTGRQDFEIFLFNTDFSDQERNLAGHPRGKYSNWIGHMHPNDTQAGYDLADILIQEAAAEKKNTAHSIIAVSGSLDSAVSNDRVAGLRQRVARDGRSTLNQVFSTTWARENAQTTVKQGLNEYPATTIVWTASDELALGSTHALKAKGRKPGQDVIVGSFDWSADGLQAIKEGDIAASMGGHFMEAGWAMVMLYDHHNGIDFKDDTGVEIVTTMQPINKINVNKFLLKLGDRNWSKINFKKFTKTNNSTLKTYDFSLDAIFANMESSN